MKPKLCLFILFLLAYNFCKAQEPVLLDTSMFNNSLQVVSLSAMDGWIYKQGSDTTWAKQDVDITGWKKFQPTEFSIKNADKNGKAEGWFRIKIKPDSSFLNSQFVLNSFTWAITDIYIDGKLVASNGNTDINGKPYEEVGQGLVSSLIELNIGKVYTIAIHITDFRSPFDASKLKGETGGYGSLVNIGTVKELINFFEFWQEFRTHFIIWASVCAVLSVLFSLLYFLNRSEKILLLIAIAMAGFAIAIFCDIQTNGDSGITFLYYTIYDQVQKYLFAASGVILLFILTLLLKRKTTILLILLIIVWQVGSLFFFDRFSQWISAMPLAIGLYLLVSSWKNLKGAQWAVAGGLIINLISYTLYSYNFQKYNPAQTYINLTVDFLSVPLSLMVYVAIRFKEMLIDVQTNAKQVVQLSEEKKEQAIKQQKLRSKFFYLINTDMNILAMVNEYVFFQFLQFLFQQYLKTAEMFQVMLKSIFQRRVKLF